MKNFVLLVLLTLICGCTSANKYEPASLLGFTEASDNYRQRMEGEYLAKQSQIAEEDLKLKSLYRKCVEDNYGKPDAIKQYCEPIVAPLRISGLSHGKS